MNERTSKILNVALSLAVVALCLLPGGIILKFQPQPPLDPVYEACPIFSGMALGYGYFGPAIGGALGVVMAVMDLAAWRKKKGMERGRLFLSAVALLAAAQPILAGVRESVTGILALVWLLLAIQALLSWRMFQKK